MKLMVWASLLVGVLHAAPVFAQQPVEPPPPSANEIAEARRLGDVMLRSAGAADLFDNITTGRTPSVRHKASGFLCPFGGVSGEGVTVFPSIVRGDDVGCTFQVSGATITLYATRYNPPPRLEQMMVETMAGIVSTYPDTTPFAGPVVEMDWNKPPGFPEVRTERFTYTINRRFAYSRMSLAVFNDWVLKERTSTAVSNAASADFHGMVYLMVGITAMVEGARSVQFAP